MRVKVEKDERAGGVVDVGKQLLACKGYEYCGDEGKGT